jgi:hypothetical protein
LLLGAIVVLAPLLVDSAAVRAVIEREVSARVGGKVRYESIRLRLFPVPRAEILGVTVFDPDLVTGRAAVLSVKLSLAALLSGRVRPTAIRVEEPALEIRLSRSHDGAGDPFAAYREWAGPVVDGLVREAAGLAVEVSDGRVDVSREGQPVVALSKVAVQAVVGAHAVDVRASGVADRWRSAEARLRIVPGSLAGSGQLQVRGLDTTGPWTASGAVGGLAVRPGPVDVRLEAETDGHAALRATIDAATPQLALERGAQRLELGAARVAGDVTRDTSTLAVSLRRLTLGDLVPETTGALRARADGGAPALQLELAAVDLARLRAAAIALAGDVDIVGAAAEIVRTGTLRSLRIESAGSTFAALADGIRLTSIEVERLGLEVRLGGGGGGGTREPLAAYRESLGPIVDRLARDAPGLSVRIVEGRVDVIRDGKPVVTISKLAAQAGIGATGIDVHLTGVADRWRAAEAQLRLVPESHAGSLRLKVSGLDAPALDAQLGTPVTLVVRPEAIDARLEAETDGRDTMRATIDVASPRLVLERGTRQLELGAISLAAYVTRDARTMVVALRRLALGDLLPGATGTLHARADGAAPTLELQMSTFDLGRLRKGALTLAGDIADVRAAADVVRSGMLRNVTLATAGRTLDALAEIRAIRAGAELDAGAIAIPELGIEVADGRGVLALTGGTLSGSGLSWTIGRSSFRAGTLGLALVPAVSLKRLGARIDMDLSEALPMARRTLDLSAAPALADIESLEGRAVGSFGFEEGGDHHPDYRIDLTSLVARGRYRRMPFPLSVSAGELRYARGTLRVGGLAATVGRSRITDAAADLILTEPGTVRAASGKAVLELDELYPWLVSLERLRLTLKEMKSATGTVDLRLAHASGSLGRLDFEATVEPHELRATLTELPAPLTLAGGEARVTQDTLQLDRIRAALLDAGATVSGRVESYPSLDRRLDLRLSAGSAGPGALEWLRTRWKIHPTAMPRAPVLLETGRLQWTAAESGVHAAQGTLRLAGGARAEIDLAWGPETVDVRRLALKDADSDAAGSFRWAPQRASLAYAGRVDHRSIVRIMAEPPAVLSRLVGNFRAAADLVDPRQSTVTGTLVAEGLERLEDWGLPMSIERLQVAADGTGRALTIRDSAVKVAGQRIALDGSIAIRQKTIMLDLRTGADRIDAGKLLAVLARDHGSDGSKPGPPSVPLEGRVAVTAKSITLGERAIESVVGTVRLEPNRTAVELDEARLCDISVPLSATFTPEGATVSGRIATRGAALDTVLPCLFPGRDLEGAGRLDVDAEYAASGPTDELARRLRASVRARGRAGRIQYTRLGPKILALEPVAERMDADAVEDIAARGLTFRDITVAGTLDAGRFQVERLTLDSRVLGLGLTGAVDIAEGQLALRGVIAPFSRATAPLRRVPLVGRLVGGNLVGIPFSVSGDWHDPRVTPLGPEAIAGTLVDVLGWAVNAPIRLLNPFRQSRDRLP